VTIDLAVTKVTVRFGGLVAVDDLSLVARGEAITGLIGPNGAGKTTSFNAIAGVVQPASGSVRLGDEPLDRLSPATRAQRGLGRTFQRIELFDSMTVRENVAMGPELRAAGRRVWCHLAGGRAERAAVLAAADEAMEQCGLARLAGRTAGDLSTGERRLVELARAMATGFRFLLLDEPSSGLDPRETEAFEAILADLVLRTGVGILLVEHDMAMVRAVCSFTYVLDFGRLIFEGTTKDVLASDVVRAAYLGSDAVEGAA
jgi:ABC-type branched-subunit amino acid transport system ATPase component